MSGRQRQGHEARVAEAAIPAGAPGEVLGRARAEDGLALPDLEAMWRELDEQTRPEREGWRDRLRHLSTPRRVALALFVSIALAVLALVVGGARTDLGTQTIVRYAVAFTGLAVLLGATFAVSLRGAHQRPLGPVGWAVVAASVLVPVVLAVMPWLWVPVDPVGTHPVSHVCLPLGIGTGALAAAAAWLFQRGDMPVAMRLLSAMGGGGLVGFAMLQLHCPAHDATHLLIGHAGVGLFLVLVAAGVVWWRGRSARRG